MAKCSITITFDREFDRNYFTGQMSDGHGENFCDFARIDKDLYRCQFSDDEFYGHAINMALKYESDRERELAEEAAQYLADTRQRE